MLASTPGGPAGPFYDACRSETWVSFHVSCLDSKRVSPKWVEERRKDWGESSPLFRARVLGEFPEESEGTLFSLSDLEAAIGRAVEPEDANRGGAGLDCAEYGPDWSVLTNWLRGSLEHLEVYKDGLDPVQLAVWAAFHLNRWGINRIAVDVGGVGSGTEGKLREPGFLTDRIHAGGSASDGRLFARRNIEMAWHFREGLQKGLVSFPKDLPYLDRLIAELSAFRYGYDASGRLVLLKDETKKLLGRSPDLGDSAVMGHAATSGNIGTSIEGVTLTANVELEGNPWGDIGETTWDVSGDEARYG